MSYRKKNMNECVIVLRKWFSLADITDCYENMEGEIETSFRGIFRALASLTRINIYNLLLERKCLSFSDIMKELNIKSPKHLRYHLEIMKRATLIEEEKIRFTVTRKKKSKTYFYLNLGLKITASNVEKPILNIPLTSDRVTDLIAKFEEQRRKEMIPEEVAQEIVRKIQIAKELQDIQNKITDVKFRCSDH